jgi:formylglycine-generating enzyme required for sulfatase activity
MAGNVWEWVSSKYHDYPYDAMDGRENMETFGINVVRGGSWVDNSYGIRVASRYGAVPDTRDNNIGFRCARSP